MTARCTDCGGEFRTNQIHDEGLCPRCLRIEDAIYRNDPLIGLVNDQPWKWSKSAMKERLGTTTNFDE